jgi:radical SAM superfamily enzyme YgiQ (UPF0313 family)
MQKIIPLPFMPFPRTDGIAPQVATPRVLLVGPYDPTCGEYTFLAPPLGVWRLAGVLTSAGAIASVFDPNCCNGPTEDEFEAYLRRQTWDVIGFSTTGMTLRFDLGLAHLARRICGSALIVAGGMEATFNPETLFQLGPFDLIALGEGERPLLELVDRLRCGAPTTGITGTGWMDDAGHVQRVSQPALDRSAFRDATYRTPYELMPIRRYWEKLARAYKLEQLPIKAEREARLAEIRSVRVNTLNYCPMGCTFCSSTNFLNEAQGGTARVARLDAAECLEMVQHILGIVPDVRTIIFQDDIFVFTADSRIQPLCEGIIDAKRRELLPPDLQFISTNRIDAMNAKRLAMMKEAGFRVLGFGVESFSPSVLTEFNKGHIWNYITTNLREALSLGITPFLDLILSSPRCQLTDVANNVSAAFSWLLAGCEAGMYPYVIPFAGAALARDPTLKPFTVTTRYRIAGTDIMWEQPTKILPVDPIVREMLMRTEQRFNERLALLEHDVAHLPSRVRSLLWIVSAIPVLSALGQETPPLQAAVGALIKRLPLTSGEMAERLSRMLYSPTEAAPRRLDPLLA